MNNNSFIYGLIKHHVHTITIRGIFIIYLPIPNPDEKPIGPIGVLTPTPELMPNKPPLPSPKPPPPPPRPPIPGAPTPIPLDTPIGPTPGTPTPRPEPTPT